MRYRLSLRYVKEVEARLTRSAVTGTYKYLSHAISLGRVCNKSKRHPWLFSHVSGRWDLRHGTRPALIARSRCFNNPDNNYSLHEKDEVYPAERYLFLSCHNFELTFTPLSPIDSTSCYLVNMPYSHHSHSGQFCGHAKDTLEDVIQNAIAKGFLTFALTEHIPRPFQDFYPGEVRSPQRYEQRRKQLIIWLS